MAVTVLIVDDSKLARSLADFAQVELVEAEAPAAPFGLPLGFIEITRPGRRAHAAVCGVASWRFVERSTVRQATAAPGEADD